MIRLLIHLLRIFIWAVGFGGADCEVDVAHEKSFGLTYHRSHIIANHSYLDNR